LGGRKLYLFLKGQQGKKHKIAIPNKIRPKKVTPRSNMGARKGKRETPTKENLTNKAKNRPQETHP